MNLGISKRFRNKIIGIFLSITFSGFLLVLSTPDSGYSQEGFNNWSIGIRGGSSFAKMNIDTKVLPVYGINVRYAASPYVAIQGNFDMGRFKSVNPVNDIYERTFTNDYYQYSLTGNINLLRLFDINQISRRVSLYGLLGVGQIFSNVKTHINTNVTDYIAFQGKDNKEASIFAVGGAGVRFNLSPRFDFFVQYEYTYTSSAYIDGYNYSSHLNKDRYTFLSSGISIKLGKRDKPHAEWKTRHAVWQDRFSAYENQMKDIRRDFINLGENHKARLTTLEQEQNNLKETSEDSKQAYSDLNQKLQKVTEIKNTIDDTGISSQISILFAFDSAEILPQADIVLGHLVKNLTKYPKIHVKIIGYTDSTGSVTYNENLAMRRAHAIHNYFKTHGIDTNRISIEALGEVNPVATNESILGRTYNRRVEIILLR